MKKEKKRKKVERSKKKHICKDTVEPFTKALQYFKGLDDMINALEQDKIVAYGDYYPDVTIESNGFHKRIEASCWNRLKYNLDNNTLFGGVDDHGSDDPVEYRNIVVHKKSLDDFRGLKKAGRKPEYDWEKFLQLISVETYKIGKGTAEYVPPSLRDWARNAITDYKVCWPDKTPSETQIENKLKPIWEKL